MNKCTDLQSIFVYSLYTFGITALLFGGLFILPSQLTTNEKTIDTSMNISFIFVIICILACLTSSITGIWKSVDKECKNKN